MIRWLLDTDHISLQERGHPTIRRKLEAVPPEEIALSAVTLEEMLRGRLALLSRKLPGHLRVQAYRKLVETVLFLNTVPIISFDETCEDRFQKLRGLRLRVGSQDLRIASTALVHGLTVVTRNHKDFSRVPELKLEDWSV